MAERWQQWMPFHIDRFRGSPDVRAMHPAAQMGYLYLLASAWQSPDCTISNDPLDLASDSCLGDELWSQYNIRIIRKFDAVEGGRLRNEVLYAEWKEAKRIFESRVAAAKKTTEIRSPRKSNTVTVENIDGDRAPTDTVTSRRADTITETLTGTENIGLTPLSPTAPAMAKIRPEEFANTWNRLRGNLPKVESFTDSRRKKVIARINEKITLERFSEAVENCRIKPHLRGDNGWTADFDWLIKNSTNIEKAINNPYGITGEIKNGKIDRAYNAAAKLIQEVEDHHGANAGELLPWSGAE